MTAQISVVMGTYNGATYIGDQLRTILTQSEPPYEVIVADDGSTDDTVAIVESIAAQADLPVRLHRNENRLGFADNFLTASLRARGTHIAFSDQDDLWHPDKLKVSLAALIDSGSLLCSHLVNHIDARGERLEHRQALPGPRVIESDDADPWSNFYGFTMLFERSLLDRLPASERGHDPHTRGASLSHDRWIYFLASTFGRMLQLDVPLADYRQHQAQMYGGLTPRSVRERVETKLREGEQETLYLSHIARDRAALLEKTAAGEDGSQRLAAAERWRSFERNLLRSADLYGGLGAVRRGSRLVRNYRTGAYGPFRDGGLGRLRFRHDVVMTAVPRIRLLINPPIAEYNSTASNSDSKPGGTDERNV